MNSTTSETALYFVCEDIVAASGVVVLNTVFVPRLIVACEWSCGNAMRLGGEMRGGRKKSWRIFEMNFT